MTKTQIANLAVYHMGGRAITNIDTDDSQEAIVIRAWFDAARDEILRSHPWNFASRRARLGTTFTAVSGIINSGGLFNVQTTAVHSLCTNDRVLIQNAQGNTNVNGYWFVTVPNNRNFTLQDSTYSTGYTTGAEWVKAPASEYDYLIDLPADCLRVIYVDHVEQQFAVEGGKLLCNVDKPVVKYVSKITDTESWTQDFTNAFSFLLASYIAQAINGPAGKAADYRNMYEKILLPQAKIKDSKELREKVIDRDQYSEIVIARESDWYQVM